MLNDKDAYDIAKIYDTIERELIDDMMKNFAHHRAEETEEGYDWEQWQVLQLQALEEYKNKNLQKYTFKGVRNRIKHAITNANAIGGGDAEKLILRALKKGLTAKRQGSEQFFKVNENRVNALIDAVQNDLDKAQNALLRKANDAYRKIIFKTQVQASTGSITYEKAVDLATKDFLTAGIQCIQYKNGAMHTISNYAQMAMRTSMKRAYLQGEATKRNEWGIATVIVNHRNHACSKCLPFVGKVLVDDVYGDRGSDWYASYLSNEWGFKVQTLSSAMEAGFLHPNCKDGLSTYFHGITPKPKPMTKQEIAYAEAYEEVATDAQGARNKADAFRRLAEYALDPQDKRMYTARMIEWEEKAKQYEETLANMPPVYETAPPVNRPPIRQEIPIKYGFDYKGIIELPDNWVEFEDLGTGRLYFKEPKSRLEIPWDDLPSRTQRYMTYHQYDRYGKSFYIQKKDLERQMLRSQDASGLSDYDKRRSRYDDLIKAGYEWVGTTDIYKYNNWFDLYFFKKDGKMYLIFEEAQLYKKVEDETVKAINKRQKEVSKLLWDRNVRFSDLTYRQGDDWVQAMKEFHTVMEADLPVTWVTEAEYESIEGEKLLRGFAQNSHLRGDITSGGMTTQQMADQLMKGGVADCFPSRGVYGDCIAYVSNNEKLAYEYATGYSTSEHGFIAEMKLKRDARGISYDDAKDLFEALNHTSLTAGADPYFSTHQRRLSQGVEVGKAMQLLGYDYIYEERGDGLPVHFYMILNRDAVVACPTKWIRNGDVRIGWKGYDQYRGY